MVSVDELANFIVDPDECDPRLHQAAFNGDNELLHHLLQNENFTENINCRSRPFGATALRLAATGGHPSCVQVLLNYGAQVDLPDYKAQSALFVAIKNHHVECARILLEAGANPNGLRANRCSPLYIACQSGFTEGMKLLLKYGASTEIFECLTQGIPSFPLQVAILYQHLPCVVELLINGAVVNLKLKYTELTENILAQLSLTHLIVKFQIPVIYAHLVYVFGVNLWQRDLKNKLCIELPTECESKSFFQEVMGKPLSLIYLCRNSIRQIVGQHQKLLQLPLPKKLIDFILCKEIYDVLANAKYN